MNIVETPLDSTVMAEELEEMEKLCRVFIGIREEGVGVPMQMFQLGLLVGQCVKIYNLNPPGGLINMNSLFRTE